MPETETKTKNELCTTEQCLRPRPLWQRLVYPLIGVILIILGIIGWLMPVVPGFPLIIIGIPWLACFHPRFELWVRRQMHRIGHAIMQKIRSAKHHEK
ncbi:MAG: hypothetical protein Q7T18_08445 [Sedimentisphaerales bacterium]|nr:hypothetical protein [Sedimentisphaerales bacterium]